jgi:hypothetical protein
VPVNRVAYGEGTDSPTRSPAIIAFAFAFACAFMRWRRRRAHLL